MNFTALFAILGGVLGALVYLVANIRLGWILLAIVVWAVWDHQSDGPAERQQQRMSQDQASFFKRKVIFDNFRLIGDPRHPNTLSFNVTNPLEVGISASPFSAICLVSLNSGKTKALHFHGTKTITVAPHSSQTITAESSEFNYYPADEPELQIDLTKVACEPGDFLIDHSALVKKGIIQPLGAEEEIVGYSDIKVSGKFVFGHEYNQYDKQWGNVVAEATIRNGSRFALKRAWVGCKVEGAEPDRPSSGVINFYIPPGEDYTFKLKLSYVRLHGYIDRPKGDVHGCEIKDFDFEEP